MACDGEIANEEINLVKSLAEKTTLFEGIDVENVLNSFIQEINKKGKLFLGRDGKALRAESVR